MKKENKIFSDASMALSNFRTTSINKWFGILKDSIISVEEFQRNAKEIRRNTSEDFLKRLEKLKL